VDPHLMTTPFGRRPFSFGQMAAQALAKDMQQDAAVHKWRILRSLTIAKGRLGLADRALSVLDALLSFHPDTALTPGPELTVFPSNRELALRAKGAALRTLQSALGQLVEAGLVIRRDSPNGKRYARRGEGGSIAQAFGFDLSPLVARATEIEAIASEVEAEHRRIVLLRERITLHRRDIAKTIAAAIEAGAAEQGASGDWTGFVARHQALSGRLRRSEPLTDLEPLAADLHALHVEVVKCLEGFLETRKTACSACEAGADIQNSNPDLHESEPGFRGSWGRGVEPQGETSAQPSAQSATDGEAGEPRDAQSSKPQAFPLGMVLDACPDIADWSRTGIASWRDFVGAAQTVRSGLGISPSAWDEAKEAMGEIPAAIVVAAILQKGEEVRSAGGYLRSLTEKARAGQFSLGPILMALLRANMKGEKRKRA
jgi:replication initiation protein RepC